MRVWTEAELQSGQCLRGFGQQRRRRRNSVALRFGGTTVAGENSSYCNVCDSYTEGHSVFAIDLRTGAVLGRAVSPAPVQSMVVKPDGALAWIAAGTVNENGLHEEWVYAHERAGTRLLAHGSEIGDSLHSLGARSTGRRTARRSRRR
jgi:hypothetical protein